MRRDNSVFFGTGFNPLRATARANVWGVHGGASASRTMPASMVLRTLESLVNDLREVEARFMFVALRNYNDANVFTRLGVCDRDDLIFPEPEGQEVPSPYAPRV